MQKNIIAVANQKGGVGKTTTVVNLATSLANKKLKVLVIDLDPQANATTGCGIEKNKITQSIYDVLINNASIKSCTVKSKNCGFDLLPSNRNLAGAEVELVDIKKREYRLKEKLAKSSVDYDVVIIDCPPSLSMLTINGLVSADYLLVPIQCEYYALEGLSDLLNTIGLLQVVLNPDLKLLGLIRTMFDKRNNLANQVSEELFNHFPETVFDAYVPRNVRLAEAPSFGTSAVALDKFASGSKAYNRIAKELLKRLK